MTRPERWRSEYPWHDWRLLKKSHLLRSASSLVIQRTGSTPHSSGFRLPCIWNFLNSLRQALFQRPDWLGPAYLPLHAYNPLERVLSDVSFEVLLASEESLSSGDRRVLDAFGV